MKIMATLHRTIETEWKIRIVPRRTPSGEYEQKLIELWKPNNTDEGMLMYNPVISLVIRNKLNKDAKAIMIPINQVYQLEDALSVGYNRLSTKGLYTSDGKTLYLDAKLSEKSTTRLQLFREVVTFTPVVMYIRNTDEAIKGIRISINNVYVADLAHSEVREICEVLNHLDVHTYGMILTLLEQLYDVNQKLDTIMGTQSMILAMLQQQNLSKVKVSDPKPVGGLDWKPLA